MVASANVLFEPITRGTDLLDVYKIRDDFPILKQEMEGKPLVYLDNAASSQKPQSVIDAISQAYTGYYSNIHRGVHWLSQKSTDAYEGARKTVQHFLNAADSREIVFTRGTTESINLVAHSFGRKYVGEGDEILISTMEHHSNIVPWQLLCEETGAVLRVVSINDEGEFLFDEFEKMIGPRTKLVSVVHVSNALGTINPVKRIVDTAHAHNIPVLIDGAQAVPHLEVDVQELDCDFYVFSGHKIYGPSGIGVLYGKSEYLDAMPPYQGGGDMILSVSFEKTTFNTLPHKFEAGTPNIVGAIGLGAAIDYIHDIGLDVIADYEHGLLEYATELLEEVPALHLVGTAQEKASVLSFVIEDIHPHDIGTILDYEGIAIRTGHHCAQPVMERFNIPATARASLAFYNTREEIDKLILGIHKVMDIFQ